MKSSLLATVSALVVITAAFACSPNKEASSNVLANPGDNNVSVTFKNLCAETVIVGQMNAGDFATLRPGQQMERSVGRDTDPHPAKAYYAFRENQYPGYGNMSLAEFSFNPNGTPEDWYDVSYVDAFSVPMKIRADYGQNCAVVGCAADMLPGCPAGNRIVKDGRTIGCSKFGDRDTPYNAAAQHFENMCKEAYSWSKDDWATKSCFAQDYVVEICPR